MKKAFLAILVCMASVSGFAQTEPAVSADTTVVSADTVADTHLKVGYISYRALLDLIPQTHEVQRQMAELRNQYEQEMQRVEQEFNQKFETFLESRNDYPRTILLKRQNELQQLMQQNIEFRSQAQRELVQAEEEAMRPVHDMLHRAIAIAATDCGVAFVLNTDDNATPFIDSAYGIDLSSNVLNALADIIAVP
jgi:outer membrane protein